jgi:hypothetical protein
MRKPASPVWNLTRFAIVFTQALLVGAFQNSTGTDAKLSAAEQAAIKKSIGALRSNADRGVANSWSDSKKVAEAICRPAALPVIRKQTPGADRVFLGTEATESLTLENNKRLTGSGQFRYPKGWQEFTFACDINPDTAKVTGFQITPKPAGDAAH